MTTTSQARIYVRKSSTRTYCAVCKKHIDDVPGRVFYTLGNYKFSRYKAIFKAEEAACITCTRDRLLVHGPLYPGGEVW